MEFKGDMVMAKGRVMAIAAPPPKPGSAPKKMPSAMPPAAIARVSMVREERISSKKMPPGLRWWRSQGHRE